MRLHIETSIHKKSLKKITRCEAVNCGYNMYQTFEREKICFFGANCTDKCIDRP